MFVNWVVFVVGGDHEGPWFMPDILVNVHRTGEESVGVIREVLPVCWPRNLPVYVCLVLLDLYAGIFKLRQIMHFRIVGWFFFF